MSAQVSVRDSLRKSQMIHPALGTSFENDSIRITLLDRKQNYSVFEESTLDKDVDSPKSVNIHPSGNKYYVNSLEAAKTVVYDFQSGKKLKVVRHSFEEKDINLWAAPSGLFPFRHQYKDPNTFSGKPVESTFSHGGRYLWIPYYRRSYDLNAQDPSAMAVIDTDTDEIVRLFETGPLPKMVAVSPDSQRLAVTHWGDNTVGVLDVSSENPQKWHYLSCVVVDYQLKLDYSLTQKVNRDVNSGYCLRGTAFSPDSRYLFVGCMGGGGGIAVIDLRKSAYLGRILGAMPNIRHLIIENGFLYASINEKGYVQRIPIQSLIRACRSLDGGSQSTVQVDGWESCKVLAGARTIDASPDGRYIFAACNYSSCVAIVKTSSMKMIGKVMVDSYPVGLDVSKDGRYIFTTSQGRGGYGGNAVDILEVLYK